MSGKSWIRISEALTDFHFAFLMVQDQYPRNSRSILRQAHLRFGENSPFSVITAQVGRCPQPDSPLLSDGPLRPAPADLSPAARHEGQADID
jgi:hypothetical protein